MTCLNVSCPCKTLSRLLTMDPSYRHCLSHSFITEQLRSYFEDVHLFRSEKQTFRNHDHLLLKKRTCLPEIGGDGVFLKGRVRKGQTVCLYPGLVYNFTDPIFLQSMGEFFVNFFQIYFGRQSIY